MGRAMKWIVFLTVYLAASAVLIGLGALLARLPPGRTPAAATRVAGAGPTIERIRELSELTTLRIDVADASVTEFRGRTGGTRAVLVVRGEVVIGVDLAGAKFEDLDAEARSAVLMLPQPRVQFARLDHERTKLVGVWSGGLWTFVPGRRGRRRRGGERRVPRRTARGGRRRGRSRTCRASPATGRVRAAGVLRRARMGRARPLG